MGHMQMLDYRSFASRELFAINLLTTLSDVLDVSVGRQDAEGFVAVVAHQMGRDLSQSLGRVGQPPLTLADLAEALVTLKRQIGGGFRVVQVSPELLILENDRCPFGAAVKGRETLCRMTSGVFGRLLADHRGYANVAVKSSIAMGHPSCRIEIRLSEGQTHDEGIDYFATPGVIHGQA